MSSVQTSADEMSDVSAILYGVTGAYQFPAMRRLAISTGDAFILVYGLAVSPPSERG